MPLADIVSGECMAPEPIDWAAIAADPRFQLLHRRKTRFLAGLMVFSVAYFFLLPIGAVLYPGFYRLPVFGVVNVGLLLAFSEFAMAWLIAALYLRRANREFDRLSEAINADILARHRQRRAA